MGKARNKISGIASICVVIIICVLFLHEFKIIKVSGSSMEPTYHSGNIVLLKKDRNVNNSDIIVFKRDDITYIKRVIASSKDKVELINGSIKINGVYQELYPYNGSNKTYILNDNEVFVIGDNYYNSIDSRIIGPIKTEEIIGRVVL